MGKIIAKDKKHLKDLIKEETARKGKEQRLKNLFISIK